MKILHIVPESFTIPHLRYLGSTKDILGRIEYFADRALDVDQLVVERSDETLLERLRSVPLERYAVVFVEIPVYPLSIEFIRQTSPKTKVICRSINAELYHQLHTFLSNSTYQWRNGAGVFSSFLSNLRLLKGSHYRLKLDYKCGNASNILFSITDWETRYYWNYIVGSKARNLPYFLPAKYEEEIHSHVGAKEDICVSFMGVNVGAGSFLADSLYNFNKLVGGLKDGCPNWRFMATSDTSDVGSDIHLTERITTTGFLKSPYPLLSRAKAVAILSPYGYGFKTKILEAIVAGCYVLLPYQLKKRLPDMVKPFCIEVDLTSTASFKQALSQCMEPFPVGNPNTGLKLEAFAALDAALQ
ncbi:MAG: hypothetical protein IPO22_06985 [Anaerolineales bacterium]|nr:hypothetical protein [Anaerolineales bacterium]